MNSRVTRRQALILAAAAVRLHAADDDFWNRKPPAEWGAGEIYQLTNHSPWATWVDWSRPGARHVPREFVKSVVTWESALPLREALQTPPAPVYENYYVLGVDGLPSGDYTADYLCDFARLRSSGKAKWKLRSVSAHERIRNSSVCLFAFKRTVAPIDAGTEEAIFEIELDDWFLQAKFKPKAMRYRGQLAI